MKSKNETKETKKEKEAKKTIPCCTENAYITDKRIREGVGLSDKAKIIME